MILRLALFVAVSLLASTAHAARCGDDARAWVARCASATGIAMELDSCPTSVAIVSTGEVRVEISTSRTSFKQVGEYGLSPIGNFAEWKDEPAARRRSFEAVAQCVLAEPPEALLPRDAPAPETSAASRARIPWLLMTGAVLALVACVRRWRPTALAACAVLATLVLRRWLEPFAFFHQNAQGPLWVEYAYRGDASEYGPGYPEIFGLVSHGLRPERGLLFLQELIAATVPLSGYAIARSAGATRRTASIVAVALALDPVLSRVSRSESYFSVIVALLFCAAAVLVASDRRHRVIGLVAASLLVAQAARIHPLAWVPCALVPLVLFCRPGRPWDRAKRVAVAATVMAAVTTPFVLGSMRASLGGGLGGEFMPGVRALLGARIVPVGLLVTGLALLVAVPATRRVGTRALVLGLAVSTAALFDVLNGDAPVVRAAHLHLFLPAAIAALAFVRVRGVAVFVAAIALAHAAVERRNMVLPTDARELSWALQWREELPPGAEVASLGRAHDRLLPLPLLGRGLPVWRIVDEEGRARYEAGLRYYYRSSLCSTPEGAPICGRFERTHRLRTLWVRRFPSIASLPWQPLPPGEIEVALFAVDES